MAALAESGLGAVGQDINLVPTPLLRSTHKAGALLMAMPLTYDNEHLTQKEIFEKSFVLANPPGDPDPEFDLQGHSDARWGQHSWRRFGDKAARDIKEKLDALGIDDVERDLYCGWDQYEHSKDMQIHYAGQQRSHRVKRRAITRDI